MSLFEMVASPVNLDNLREFFGDRLVTNMPMADLTTAKVGGPADAVIPVHSLIELEEAASYLWKVKVPFILLGGGSNVLVSDAGVRGVVVHNIAREVRLDQHAQRPTVWAASGTKFGLLARMAAAKNLSGLEWASGIPGTVGGAVVGNAGAYGNQIADNLILAEILHLYDESVDNKEIAVLPRREEWQVKRMEFTYRSSRLKHKPLVVIDNPVIERPTQPKHVVLSALFGLERKEKNIIREKILEYAAYRRRTQPPGASMGSMFKNPPGDYAGRLIEAVGLKGKRVGRAEISRIHGNFFINLGGAKASDIWDLIKLASDRVKDQFGIRLELEIELIGDWDFYVGS